MQKETPVERLSSPLFARVCEKGDTQFLKLVLPRFVPHSFFFFFFVRKESISTQYILKSTITSCPSYDGLYPINL